MVTPQRPFTNYNPINISKTHVPNRISPRQAIIFNSISILTKKRILLFAFDNAKIVGKNMHIKYKIHAL
jgi:hypothetical protein